MNNKKTVCKLEFVFDIDYPNINADGLMYRIKELVTDIAEEQSIRVHVKEDRYYIEM